MIHRLRIIHLYEADLSSVCAIHWRKLLHQVEDSGILNPGTYGSRPRRTAITPPLIEDLQNEISRITRKPIIKFDNDATSCYDRMLVRVGSLVSRSNRLPTKIAKVWARTLEEAIYKLKITHEISGASFQHSAATPIHGSGQGSTNSPCIWLFISSTLFDVYQCHAEQNRFLTVNANQ